MYIKVFLFFRSSSQPKKKRGRPSKKEEKEWTDDETFALINLWSQHECLYNSKSPDFSKKDKRSIALEKIVQGLKDLEKPPTQTEIQQKLTRLRCYYTAENNKVEKSKVSGTDRDSVYEPTWIFFRFP